MRLHEEVRYEAGPEAVFAVLTDPEFLVARCRASGALEQSTDVVPSGAGCRVTVRRALPTRGLPDAAARFLGERMVLAETVVWGPAQDGGRRGSLHVVIEGAPVTLTGEVALSPAGAGCVQVFDADLVAKVPLFGGKVEQAAAPALRAGLLAEAELAGQWLAQRS
ncbi:uncharacterized protein DUF2505 [Kineococcus xinjiangensis]|uniref:Uncharacterized protein DUF2505 n=1 Tax=Kineococcus xinjiangensis TaxID=512762 RepID=A0A2S6ICT9_9ACTN|nr:DUF2505 domain-containing protein [Kineococcus xinjiangensis]PPK92032.1 uncharacterized protein DUF2505 [Kineococcus xinjiangensis]